MATGPKEGDTPVKDESTRAGSSSSFFHDDVHFNEAGSKRLDEILATHFTG
jgi:hypothetical protein